MTVYLHSNCSVIVRKGIVWQDTAEVHEAEAAAVAQEAAHAAEAAEHVHQADHSKGAITVHITIVVADITDIIQATRISERNQALASERFFR